MSLELAKGNPRVTQWKVDLFHLQGAESEDRVV